MLFQIDILFYNRTTIRNLIPTILVKSNLFLVFGKGQGNHLISRAITEVTERARPAAY